MAVKKANIFFLIYLLKAFSSDTPQSIKRQNKAPKEHDEKFDSQLGIYLCTAKKLFTILSVDRKVLFPRFPKREIFFCSTDLKSAILLFRSNTMIFACLPST